jgi:hypothetical protein
MYGKSERQRKGPFQSFLLRGDSAAYDTILLKF